MSGRPNNAGIYNFDNLNAQALYIRGKSFDKYLSELTGADIFEQQEIDELKQLVQYLNTSGLSSEWIVDNQNKNQDLKTAITAIQTKLANIDTTALSESSVLTNDNRNSVLKTRIDGNDSDLSTLNGKTRYVSSVQGNNTEPKVASDFQVSIGDRDKRQIYMTTGVNSITCKNDSTNQSTPGNYADNQIDLVTQTGMIRNIAHLNSIQSIDTIEITGFGGMGIQSSPNIKIGNKGAQILIGSEDTPEIGSTNTVIKIGKQSITKNTETQLRGNVLLADARFDDLTTSSALTWSNLIGLIPTYGLPAWVASAILTSVVPSYSYSDIWAMAGTAVKNGDVETTTAAKLKGMTIYDPTVDVSIFPKVQTFLSTGDISQTTLNGGIRSQTFNGEILLRNNNIVSTNIDWALTDSMDKVNALKLSNNDVELIAGAGADNSQLRISNTTTNGKMKFRMGSGGLQSNAHDALAIYADPAAGTSQVLIAGSNVPSGYDTSTKLLVDHQYLTNGIKVTKGNEALITRVNHNNINTPSLTLQSNWTGEIANTLYLNASNQLMYNGSAVGSGAGGGTSTGGIIFLLRGPATNDIFAGAAPLLTASDTYTGLPQRSFRLQFYNAGQTYHLFTHRGDINKLTNPVIKGIWEYVINAAYSSNQPGSIYTDAYFTASEVDSASGSFMFKAYAGADQGGTGFISVGSSTYTAYWFINSYQYQFSFTSAVFGLVQYRGSNLVFRCVLEDNAGTVLYTFPDLTRTSQGGGSSVSVESLTFTAPSVQTLTQGFLSTATRMRWKLTLVSGTSVGGYSVYYNQTAAASPTNMAFQVPTGSYTTPLSLNINNPKALLFDTAAIKEYELSVPIMEFDLTLFDAPKFDLRFNFIQPSGNTTSHFLQLYFNDGSLSHCHTALNITSQVPRLDEVMARSASTPTSMYFYNGAGIQNVASISDTLGIVYSVKGLQAGVGINITGANGIFTINTNTETASSRAFRYYNSGAATAKVTFNIGPTIDLRFKKVKGTMRVQLVPGQIIFPILLFNNTHTYPTNASSTSETNSIFWFAPGSRPQTGIAGNPGAIWDTQENFIQVGSFTDGYGGGAFLTVMFEITLHYNQHTTATRQLICTGDTILSVKPIGQGTWMQQYGRFMRSSDIGGNSILTHIGIGGFTNVAGISSADIEFQVQDFAPYQLV